MDRYYKTEEIQKSLKVFIALSRTQRKLMDISNKSAQGWGLNPTEFAVLELLFHKGEQPLQRIGEKILIASGSITYVVDKLEKKDFAKRRPCPRDRRVIYAQLTQKGQELMEEMFPKHEVILHECMEMLTTEEKDQLLVLLKKVGCYE
ncbi:MarR family transcriptional regulator [Bacillus sp. 165]|uniref:MarR family winged helix-turn-helix transcriptional regulator n=1 Tax=Bacillus sp. 165 TaxID=1529117 RepID=UPI001FFE080A|nr:MarR family transcriptional regulator [Bacillus sp. 165]